MATPVRRGAHGRWDTGRDATPHATYGLIAGRCEYVAVFDGTQIEATHTIVCLHWFPAMMEEVYKQLTQAEAAFRASNTNRNRSIM